MSPKGNAIVEQLEREFPLFVFNTHNTHYIITQREL